MVNISIEEDQTLAKEYYQRFKEEKHIHLINQGHAPPLREESMMEIVKHAFQTACGLLQSEYNNTVLHAKVLNVIICRADLFHMCWEGPSFGLAIFAAFVSFALGVQLPKNAMFTGGLWADGTGESGLMGVDGWVWKLRAAKDAGISHVYYPLENNREMNELDRNHHDLYANFKFHDVWNCKQLMCQLFPRK